MNLKSGLYRLVRAWLTYRCRGAVRIAVYSRELDLEDFYGVAAWMILPMVTVLAPPILVSGLVRYGIRRAQGHDAMVSESIWDVVRWLWSLPMEGAQLDQHLWDDMYGRLDRL